MAAHMWFCPSCGNLLYPKEDRESRKLNMFCKQCGHEGDSEAGFEVVHQRQVVRTAENHLAKVKKDVVNDPALPRNKSIPCPSCMHTEAVFLQVPPSPADDRMHLILVCCACSHKWQKK